MADAEQVLETIRAHKVRALDLRFTDLQGRLRRLAIQAGRVDAALLQDGVLIDGSAIAGWRDVSEADILLKPDLTTAFLDPFSAQPVLALVCDVGDPATGVGYERCPRSIARRAEEYLARSGLAERALFAVELAFYVFDDVRSTIGPREVASLADSPEAPDNAGTRYAGGNSGHRPDLRDGYLAAPPVDQLADLRLEVAGVLEGLGVPGLVHHHALSPGQSALAFDHDRLLTTADRIQLVKHVAHNVASTYGKTATFLPKPAPEPDGSGMAVHQSLWRQDRPLFAGNGYADLSETCLHYIGGIIHHARALNAFTNPTTNSYRRLAPGLEAPGLLAYAAHNRSAALRIPYAASHEGKRVEVRFPDPSANPYLAFAAMLMAGLDGIERRLDPGEAMDRSLYDLPAHELEDIPRVAGSLREALSALESDHGFLLKGEVMQAELIRAYVDLKMAEVQAIERTPHPLEFRLYYSV